MQRKTKITSLRISYWYTSVLFSHALYILRAYPVPSPWCWSIPCYILVVSPTSWWVLSLTYHYDSWSMFSIILNPSCLYVRHSLWHNPWYWWQQHLTFIHCFEQGMSHRHPDNALTTSNNIILTHSCVSNSWFNINVCMMSYNDCNAYSTWLRVHPQRFTSFTLQSISHKML